jgi:hypothetical protein
VNDPKFYTVTRHAGEADAVLSIQQTKTLHQPGRKVLRLKSGGTQGSGIDARGGAAEESRAIGIGDAESSWCSSD